MRLPGLPQDVLCRIMRQANQPDRVACMTTCKALKEAACAPGAWSSVRFSRDLDDSAIRFMDVHRCANVQIASSCPDDVAWFFEMLAKASIDCVETLVITIGKVARLPTDFLRGICAQTKLRVLSIMIQSLEHPSEIHFAKDHELASLRALTIMEMTEDDEPMQLVVWWEASHARFKELELVGLRVGVSDIMCGARRMPNLQRLMYSCEPYESGETYEDAQLEGVDLQLLSCVVDLDTDLTILCEQLALAKRVRKLVLNCHFDADLTGFEWHNVEEVELCMHGSSGEVKINFQSLKDLQQPRRLELRISNAMLMQEPGFLCKYALLFTGVPTPREWAEYMVTGLLDMHLPPAPTITCVQLVV